MTSADDARLQDQLISRIKSRDFVVGIVGLGYVGLPLALVAVKSNFTVIGFDIDADRVAQLNAGVSAIKHIPSDAIREARGNGKFRATADFDELSIPDAILIAVPTPLSRNREPDLTFVVNSTQEIRQRLRPGQLIVLESTTWPGTTNEVLKPILESSGLKSGQDFYLAFSPEREDPGNEKYGTATIPKVVGGEGAAALEVACALYSALVVKVVPVSSSATAEAVKLTENIFRSVNIALVNELKVIYEKMAIDVWEVIEAAKTKPFGYMPFYPGPGLGGHCIPIDPFYLSWKAREFDVTTRFIELAGEINTAMPNYVVDRTRLALDQHAGRGLRDARILILGVAYKKNVDDMRESPSLRLIELLETAGARADYHDPFVPVIPRTREHAALSGRTSVPLAAETLREYDLVMIATDHSDVDYGLVANNAKIVVDTRNACAAAGLHSPNIVKA